MQTFNIISTYNSSTIKILKESNLQRRYTDGLVFAIAVDLSTDDGIDDVWDERNAW